MAEIQEKCPRCGSLEIKTWLEKVRGMQCKNFERWFKCFSCEYKTIIQ